MMNDIAIRVENLGKSYQIGRAQHHHDTLRDALMAQLRTPFQRLSRGGHHSDCDQTIWALKDVSFTVKRGEVLGVIGSNGAGKSTLLKILSRITEPTHGLAEIDGRVGSLLEVGTGFHPELTGRENIYLNGAILGMRRGEINRKFDEIVAFSEIEKFLDTPVKRYSSGMYVRLAFSVAAHLEPEVLLVDEVLAVGDAGFQKRCLGKMGDVAREGRTVLFVSHQLDRIKNLCYQAILFEQGVLSNIGMADRVVNEYLRAVEDIGTGQIFPIMNSIYQLGIENCDAEIVERTKDASISLKVHLKLISKEKRNRIGIGFGLLTEFGRQVVSYGSKLTNYTFDLACGTSSFVIECSDIGRLLSEGRYIVKLWLTMPGMGRVLEADRAAVVFIPGRNFFGTGMNVQVSKHGPVLMPLTIRRD